MPLLLKILTSRFSNLKLLPKRKLVLLFSLFNPKSGLIYSFTYTYLCYTSLSLSDSSIIYALVSSLLLHHKILFVVHSTLHYEFWGNMTAEVKGWKGRCWHLMNSPKAAQTRLAIFEHLLSDFTFNIFAVFKKFSKKKNFSTPFWLNSSTKQEAFTGYDGWI